MQENGIGIDRRHNSMDEMGQRAYFCAACFHDSQIDISQVTMDGQYQWNCTSADLEEKIKRQRMVGGCFKGRKVPMFLTRFPHHTPVRLIMSPQGRTKNLKGEKVYSTVEEYRPNYLNTLKRRVLLANK